MTEPSAANASNRTSVEPNTLYPVEEQQQQQHLQQQRQDQEVKQQQQQPNNQPPYTIAGVLHYLQYEWHRFEAERQEWEVEKAELSARVAMYQGEKKTAENLKRDLIRRIKMLEHCLRCEREKYTKLLQTKDSQQSDIGKQITEGSSQANTTDEAGSVDKGNSEGNFNYGREELKHYLMEIGYTDLIIDARTNRLRSLVGFTGKFDESNCENRSPPLSDPDKVEGFLNQFRNYDVGKSNEIQKNDSISKSSTTDTSKPNESVASQISGAFGFLQQYAPGSNALDEEEEEESEDLVDDMASSVATSVFLEYSNNEMFSANLKNGSDTVCNSKTASPKVSATQISPATPTAASTNSTPKNAIQKKSIDQTSSTSSLELTKNWVNSSGNDDGVDIGELAELTTLPTDSELSGGSRKQWTAKYKLQSHFDCVRALKFFDTRPILLTASEDETLKLWNLTKPSANGKSKQTNQSSTFNAITNLESSVIDLEPLYTYRGHSSVILSLTISRDDIYSGAKNGELIRWKSIADLDNIDQYDSYPNFKPLVCIVEKAHNDSIWALETVESLEYEILLCSGGSDKTIRIWNTAEEKLTLLMILELPDSPTWICRMPSYNTHRDLTDIVVSFCDGNIRLYNITETLDKNSEGARKVREPLAILTCDTPSRINSIAIHPTLPYLVSAHSNRDIKFWDLKTRECIHTMVAHLEEVTSLAVDPNGEYLLSASHDCSVRLWSFDEKKCIQDIQCHRKKYDEAVIAVAFHPKFSHFATAGSDGLAKVFV